jgi:hypothetical protein
MKKLFKIISLILILFSIPFLLVWVAYLFTGFAFVPRETFHDVGFWLLTTIYYIIIMCAFPFIYINLFKEEI